MPRKILEDKLRNLLAEDIGQGDLTTMLIISPESSAQALVIAKQDGIIAGMEEAQILAESFNLKVESLVSDGERVKANKILMRISGDTRTILSVERTLLNIMSRMTGIATTTKSLTQKLQRSQLETKIACTRKVAPGLLYFDKKAVSIGGGDTHRLHLDDMILIKDNHIKAVGSIEKAIDDARSAVSFTKKIEVEVTEAADALVAARAGADIIMLDNFSPHQIEEAVELLKKERLIGKVLLEASGGITSKNILSYASTEVDIISLGEITDSAKTLDISLEIVSAKTPRAKSSRKH